MFFEMTKNRNIPCHDKKETDNSIAIIERGEICFVMTKSRPSWDLSVSARCAWPDQQKDNDKDKDNDNDKDIETFDQSYEETWHDQQKDNDKYKDKDI